MSGKKSFHPLHDNLLVRRLDEDTRTAGGIIIPDTAQEKPSQGVVVAAGPGGCDEKGSPIKMVVKEGQTVLFKKWAGTDVKLNDEELIIVKQGDVLGVFE